MKFPHYVIQYTLDLRKPDLRKNLDLRKIAGATDFLVHKLFDLTRNRPVTQLWCPRPKSNMGDFSFLSGPQVYEEATQGKEWNSLHALKGIGKEGKTVTLSITYIE